MKKLMTIAAMAAVSTLASVSAAQAATTTLDPGPGQYTFSGQAALSVAGIINPNCTLSLTGSVSKDANGNVTINVTDGSVEPGDATCSAVELEFNPAWTTTISQANLPTTANPSRLVMGMFSNVIVTYPGLFSRRTCNGGPSDVPATFTNGSPTSSPSQFRFNTDIGECSVNGVLNAESDINVLVTN